MQNVVVRISPRRNFEDGANSLFLVCGSRCTPPAESEIVVDLSYRAEPLVPPRGLGLCPVQAPGPVASPARIVGDKKCDENLGSAAALKRCSGLQASAYLGKGGSRVRRPSTSRNPRFKPDQKAGTSRHGIGSNSNAYDNPKQGSPKSAVCVCPGQRDGSRPAHFMLSRMEPTIPPTTPLCTFSLRVS
jgi:hypothetical protein